MIRALACRRPALSVETLVLVAAVLFAAAYNGALWRLLLPGSQWPDLLSASLFVVVVALQFAGMALVVTRHTVKPVLGLLFLTTALATYYMDRYAILLNEDMVRNVLRTDFAEARELAAFSLLPHLLVYAALPMAALLGIKVFRRPLGRALLVRSGSIAVALVVSALALLVQFPVASALLREHREARHLLTPTNYLAALYKLGWHGVAEPGGPKTPVGLDAHRILQAAGRRAPTLLVLMVGETVRSANFGLSGYRRQTTPELAGLDPVVFPRVEACGTSTEISLPCMFSAIGRRDYDEDRINGSQSLLHLLARAGYQVVWIDNQAGCKGVCDGLAQVRIPGDADPALCDGDRCLDEILAGRLDTVVKNANGDLVVVLHMLGNHGPAYSHRYPASFRRYVPTCESLDLGECTRTEIVNSYDNALLYTDHVVANIVRYLKMQTAWSTGLIYVSDHGESLGESGLYLHGMPWLIAPAVQKEVPMVVWLSERLRDSARLSGACLKREARGPVSHDHLFHSVLGLLGIETSVREPSLDLFSTCKPYQQSSTSPVPFSSRPPLSSRVSSPHSVSASAWAPSGVATSV